MKTQIVSKDAEYIGAREIDGGRSTDSNLNRSRSFFRFLIWDWLQHRFDFYERSFKSRRKFLNKFVISIFYVNCAIERSACHSALLKKNLAILFHVGAFVKFHTVRSGVSKDQLPRRIFKRNTFENVVPQFQHCSYIGNGGKTSFCNLTIGEILKEREICVFRILRNSEGNNANWRS